MEGVEVLVRLLHRRHRGRRSREGGRGRHPLGGEEVHPRMWPGCNSLDALIISTTGALVVITVYGASITHSIHPVHILLRSLIPIVFSGVH